MSTKKTRKQSGKIKNKKQRLWRKSRKMPKDVIKGGTRGIVTFVSACIQKAIPSSSEYIKNDDDWTKLAKNISEEGPLRITCNGNVLTIYIENANIDLVNNIKLGELYVNIDGNKTVLLWRNGRQQTYLSPSGPRQVDQIRSQ